MINTMPSGCGMMRAAPGRNLSGSLAFWGFIHEPRLRSASSTSLIVNPTSVTYASMSDLPRSLRSAAVKRSSFSSSIRLSWLSWALRSSSLRISPDRADSRRRFTIVGISATSVVGSPVMTQAYGLARRGPPDATPRSRFGCSAGSAAETKALSHGASARLAARLLVTVW